jgi:DNA polymerase-4
MMKEPATSLSRKIIHVDMDAFYASVELLHHPELRGKPLIIGGSPQSRAVVCTASYEARKFGVRSAMACAHAARLCPQAIFLPPRFELYREVALKIRAIFRSYTDQVEPLSLDEAYLDVTAVTAPQVPVEAGGRYASQIAREIKQRIASDLRLTCSAGVAPNKLLAKLASEHRKPDGLTVVTPEAVLDFMRDLPVRKINGVGPVTEARLKAHGISLCRDAWAKSSEEWGEELGDLGRWIAEASRGVDDRPVEASWIRRSLGREETFARDVTDLEQLRREIDALAVDVAESLTKRQTKARTVVLKVKYADFTLITRRATLAEPTDVAGVVAATASGLLAKTEAGARPIRLLGVTATGLDHPQPETDDVES